MNNQPEEQKVDPNSIFAKMSLIITAVVQPCTMVLGVMVGSMSSSQNHLNFATYAVALGTITILSVIPTFLSYRLVVRMLAKIEKKEIQKNATSKLI
jgi:hypothetical protein